MNYTLKKYGDGQVSAVCHDKQDLEVNIRGNTYEDLFYAAAVKDAWDSMGIARTYKSQLNIKCLIAQRSDRRFIGTDSFDLKIVANFINSMGYDKVTILDPHSDVTTALINNSRAILPTKYVSTVIETINSPDRLVLISPDAGAYKRVSSIGVELLKDTASANKYRDKDGNPFVSFSSDIKGRSCLIVDDLADGGRTFSTLAKVLKESGAKAVYLYVTHGLFLYGFDELKSDIDHIYCTNSYRDISDAFVTQISVI